MKKFIKSTVGLLATNGKMIRVMIYHNKDETLSLRAASAHNLGEFGKKTIVTMDEYCNTPDDDIEFAKWAFEKVGFNIAGIEE